MKGRTSFGLIMVIVVLALLVIGVALTSTTKIRAYNFYGKLSNNDLEGMTNKEKGQERVRYAKYPSGQATNVENQHLIESDAECKSAQRVPQLPGGLYGPYQDEKITSFSDAKGSLAEQCAKTSGGMSNSTGYLCLDKSQMSLLTTRGGNQTCGHCVKSSCNCVGPCNCKQ
jgi:hypothetical protein